MENVFPRQHASGTRQPTFTGKLKAVLAAMLCKGVKRKRILVLALRHQDADDSAARARDDSTLTASPEPQLPKGVPPLST